MSIYVGDKKAKLYHGDYGPAQFYKGDVKIAGYTDAEKVGTAISGVDTYNDALKLTIEGKSEQTVTVQGKNLLDNRHVSWYSQDAIIQDGWYVAKDGYFSGVILGLFQVYSGKRYAVTFTYKSDNIGHFMISPDNSTQGLFSTNISIGLIADGMAHRGKAVFTATQDVLARVWLLKKGAATIKGTSMYKDINVIEEQTDSPEVPPYEPFVPNSPSPDYPSPIRSSENFDVVSCGRNLLDVYKWGNKNGVVPIDNVITQTFTDASLYLNDIRVPIKLKPNHPYSIVVSVLKSDITDVNVYAGLFGYANGFNDNGRFLGSFRIVANSVTVQNFTTSPDGNFALGISGGKGVPYTLSLQVMILERTYTAETLPPYEPYHATTAHITDPLRSVGNVSDSIEVSEGKVEVVRRCEVKVFDGSEIWTIYNAGANAELGYTVFFTHLSQMGVPPDPYVSICTNALWVRYGYANPISGNCHSLTSGGATLMFKTNLSATTTVTSFKEWLASQATAGTPVTILYQLATPTRTDITATPLGQALLAMRTYPNYTQVYTNATLPPMLRARIKEMEP